MTRKYKNNRQNNTPFFKQWIERYSNISQNFYDDYHINEIRDSLSKDKEHWWDASVQMYNDLTSFLKELYLEFEVMLCISISDSYTKANIPLNWDNSILNGVDTPPSIYIYNKDNTDIILWLKQCSLFDSKYLKGKKVYYNEDKEENYCYKTIFITQD